jgi:hypothetical protein
METEEGGRKPPTTLAELIDWLGALPSVERAKVAAVLVDARTIVAVAEVRRAAIYEATRSAPRAEVAAELGVSRQAIGKAITEHLKAQKEVTMDTTATTYGATFSQQAQMDGILAHINGGDYTDDQQGRLSQALFDAHRDEVDERLPQGVTWQPTTSEFLHPVNVEIPERDEMEEIFREAWQAVAARYDEIEAEALA